MSELRPILTVDDLERFIDAEFSEVHVDGRVYALLEVSPGKATLRLDPIDRHLRPGGTVSGPTLFTLADLGAYFVILAHIGLAKHTVTTNMNINFMHKPKPGPLSCHSTILKLGKRLAVVDCQIVDDTGVLVSQATATYSIPPE